MEFLCLAVVLATLVCSGKAQVCQTPNQESGKCIVLSDCRELAKLLRPPLTAANREHLQASACGYVGRQVKVCCPDSLTTTTTARPITQPSRPSTSGFLNIDGNDPYTAHRNRPLLPNGNECGKTKNSDKIFGGKEVVIGGLRWMALIGYTDALGRFAWRCGGALINDRYVLTAAHCITNLPAITPVLIRLGEHRISTNPDCQENDCAPDIQDIDIEVTVPHTSYGSPPFRHDIGLIRLKTPAQFNKFVGPVCLPFGDLALLSTKDIVGNRKLIVSGWGATENDTASDVLLGVDVPLSDFDKCKATYISKRQQIQLGDGQFCAGGETNKDSCSGDSGGPLMMLVPRRGRQPHFVCLGVVSIGPRSCGNMEPAAYTQVSIYLRWILDNIAP